MKKFLSLALALVMAMSLVTVSAGAKDFTDNEKINYDEAVAVISEVGIVDGYTDGSFNPQNVLTRGAAAKIICNMILGPTTASALTADAASFKDVPANHEFAGYIAYCAQKGIINGYSDGTFRPAGTLNGYAFMKMLLGALGYDGAIEGFTGPNWTVNVAKLALSNGIDLADGNDEFVGSKDVTREEACLYAFNTLKATMVEYGSKTSVTTSEGVTVNVGDDDAKDMENNTTSDGNIEDDGLMQFAEKYFTNLKKARTSSDDLGRPAVEWKYKSNSIGTYPDSSNLEATYTAAVSRGDLYDLIGKSTVEDIEDEDGAYVRTYVDGIETTSKKAKDDVALLFVKNSSADAGESGRGVITEVYVDDEYGKDEDETMVTVVFINTYLVQATNDYSSSKESLNIEFIDNGADSGSGFPTSIDQDDFDVSDFKEDDYILTTYSKDTKEFQSVEKAEILAGEVDTYKVKDSVTIGGEKYKYNKIVDDENKDEEFDIGSEAVLVLDAYGYILYVDEADASGNFLYIDEFGSTSGLGKQAYASAYFTDGTSAEIKVKKVTVGTTSTEKDTEISSWGDDTNIGWYTYSVNSSDEYTLKAVDGVAGNTNYSKGLDILEYKGTGSKYQVVFSETVRFLADEDNYSTKDTGRANSSTIFLVLDEDEDLDVYTGIANAPDVYMTAKAGSGDTLRVAYAVKDGYAKYVFIDASDLDDDQVGIDEVSTSDDYLFVLQSSSKLIKVSGDDNYYEYDALVEGSEESIKINEDDDDEFSVGVLYNKVKTNSDGYYTGADAIDGSDDDKVVELGCTETIDYDDDTLVIGNGDYVLSNNAEIHLIVAGDGQVSGCTTWDLLDDEDSDYELYLNISGRALESNLAGYDVEYNYYAILDDDYDTEYTGTIDILYVWVYNAVENGKVVDDDDKTTDAEKAEAAVAASIEAVNAADIAIETSETGASAVRSAILAALQEIDSNVTSVTISTYKAPENVGDLVSVDVQVTVKATVVTKSATGTTTITATVEKVAAEP